MYWDRVEIENFGPFVSTSMELGNKGLVLIEGDNRLTDAADSNGSGKSYLLEAIIWGVFGKTIRGLTGDDVINNRFGPTPKKNARVYQKIVSGTSIIEITRYRKHKTGKNNVHLVIDGADKTMGTDKETNKEIVEVLGLDYESFVRSVLFDGKEIPSFPTLTDREVKAVFERILGLDDLTKVADLVRKKKVEAETLRGNVDTEIRLASMEESTAAAEIARLRAQVQIFEDGRKAKIEAKEREIASAQSVLETAVGSIDMVALAKERDELVARHSTDQPVIAAKIAALNGEISKLATTAGQIDAEIRRISGEIASPSLIPIPVELSTAQADALAQQNIATRKLAEHNAVLANAEIKIGKPCGECGKVYQKEDMGELIAHTTRHRDACLQQVEEFRLAVETASREISDHRERELVRARATLDGLNDLRKTCVDQQTAQASQKDALDKEIEGLARIAQRVAEIDASSRAYNDAQTQRDAMRASIETMIAEVEALKAEANPSGAEIVRWDGRKTAAATKLRALEVERSGHTDRIAKFEILEKAYGRNGLKAHIIEEITPVLNLKANEYASSLTDGAVKIEFSTISKNKDGSYSERFAVTVSNNEGSEVYLGNSSGERKKIDLAISFAFADLVHARAGRPIDLWCADEIAESLDATALERVVDLLKEKAAERGTLLCISHTSMRDHIPNVWTVQKTADGSSLITGKAA